MIGWHFVHIKKKKKSTHFKDLKHLQFQFVRTGIRWPIAWKERITMDVADSGEGTSAPWHADSVYHETGTKKKEEDQCKAPGLLFFILKYHLWILQNCTLETFIRTKLKIKAYETEYFFYPCLYFLTNEIMVSIFQTLYYSTSNSYT